MLTTEEIKISNEVRAKWAEDHDYQVLINDLKDTTNRLRRAQEDRIREANRLGITKDGTEQKNLENRERELSDEQKDLTDADVSATRDELVNILTELVDVSMSKQLLDTKEMKLDKRLSSISLNQQMLRFLSVNLNILLEAIWTNRCDILKKRHPAYPFLKNVKSCGPILSAILMAQLDPLKIDYVSSFYAFCGCVKGHDRLVKGEKATFNKWLKAKILGVLAGNFIKQRSEYALYYYNRMIFLLNKENAEISAGEIVPYFGKLKPEDEKAGKRARKTGMHLMMMARRHMMQKFLRDYYCASRSLMGMPIIQSYEAEKLGLHHSAESDLTNWKKTVEFGDDKAALSKYREEVKTRCEEMAETVKDLQKKYGYTSSAAKKAEKNEAKTEDDVNIVAETDGADEE